MKSREFLFNYIPKNAICVEIGTWKGEFAQQIANQKNIAELYLVDPYTYQKQFSKSWYGNSDMSQKKMDAIYESVWNMFSSNENIKLIRKYSHEAVNEFENESLDWIYIDGNHTYKAVKQDLTLWITKVKKGGYITGDDYVKGGWWKGGVKKAVDEFIKTNKVERIEIKQKQYVLKKK